MTVQDLIQLVDAGDERADDAVEALGEYLEQGPPPTPTIGARTSPDRSLGMLSEQVVPYELVAPSPSGEPWDEVVDRLSSYVEHSASPEPRAVWALGKSRDPRAAGAMTKVLREHLDEPADEHLAFQALVGLKALPEPPLDVIRDAAERGSGQVSTTAHRFLEVTGA